MLVGKFSIWLSHKISPWSWVKFPTVSGTSVMAFPPTESICKLSEIVLLIMLLIFYYLNFFLTPHSCSLIISFQISKANYLRCRGLVKICSIDEIVKIEGQLKIWKYFKYFLYCVLLSSIFPVLYLLQYLLPFYNKSV